MARPADTKNSILFVKLGTHSALSTVAQQFLDLVSDVRVVGIGTDTTRTCDVGEIIAHERDLLLGAYDDWWNWQLFVDPALYLKVVPKIGMLLRMTERIPRGKLSKVRNPQFPVAEFSHQVGDGMQLLLRQLAFWDWILRREKVAGVVFQNVPHNFWDSTLHAVVEARGLPTLCFHEVLPFSKSIYIYENPFSMGDLGFGTMLLSEARRRYGLIPDSLDRRARMCSQVSLGEAIRRQRIGSSLSPGVWSRVLGLLATPRLAPGRLLESARRRQSLRRTTRDYQNVASMHSISEKFFFVELQAPANATSLVKGYMYGDLREMVAHVSASLPTGYSLVVRESSRSNRTRRSRREKFWLQIASLPNVRVASTVIDTHDLLERATGLIELGYSSIALESINRGLPVVVVGLTHLQRVPNVIAVNETTELKDALLQAVQISEMRKQVTSDLETDLRAWADMTRHATLEGRLSADLDDEDISDSEYRGRLTGNTARVIAAWYELRVQSMSHSVDLSP